MPRLLPLLFVVVIPAACATVDRVPFCRGESELPPPTEACLNESDAQRVIGTLTRLIDESAGSYLVEIGFDESGAVGSVCAQRSAFGGPGRSRALLGEKMREILAAHPRADCLAGTRVAFNRAAAKRAEIESIDRQCGREAQAARDPSTPSAFALEIQASRFRRCIEREQIARGEIWLPEIGQVFVRSQDGAERRRTILACSENRTPIQRSFHDAEITDIYADPGEFAECLRRHGWQSAF